jgi:MFS family permease
MMSIVFMAIAPAVMSAWPTWTGALVASGVLGLGYGMYCAVSLAVQISVLPAAADRAKDLGVINIAYTLPQVIAPIIGALVIAHLGGYRILYVLATGAMIGAGAIAVRIRTN